MKSMTELAGGEFCLPLEEEEVRFVSYVCLVPRGLEATTGVSPALSRMISIFSSLSPFTPSSDVYIYLTFPDPFFTVSFHLNVSLPRLRLPFSSALASLFVKRYFDAALNIIRIRNIYSVIFQTQETSAKTISGRCRRGHLEKLKVGM